MNGITTFQFYSAIKMIAEIKHEAQMTARHIRLLPFELESTVMVRLSLHFTLTALLVSRPSDYSRKGKGRCVMRSQ